MKDWHRKTIGDICRFSNGYGFTPRDWAKKGWPIIRIQNLNGSGNFNYFDGEPDPSWIVEPGELLFAWAGVPGVSFGPTIWQGPRGVLNQHIYRITPHDGIDRDWLYAALKVVTSRIERKAHGFKSSLLHVKKSDITDQHVHQPKLEEQVEIARIISVVDRSIDLIERLIAAKQERRTGLMQQLLTGKRRLPGFAGVWREVKLRDVFERVQRPIPDGETPEVLSITAKVGFVSQREKFSKVIAGKNLEQYVLIRRGEFSYNKGNSLTYPQGCVFRLKEFDEGAVPNVFYSFRAVSSQVYLDFYSHFFASGGLNHQLSRVINTGVRNDGLLNLNASDFFDVKVPFPPAAEQEQISKILTLTNDELDLLRSQLDALRDQKKGLMQQLLTGRIRVIV